MTNIDKLHVDKFKTDLEDVVNDAINYSNSVNGSLLSCMSTVNEVVAPFIKKLATISDMVLDLKIITGNTTNKINLLTASTYRNTNISINSNTLSIAKTNTTIVPFIADSSSLYSNVTFITLDKEGVQVRYTDLFKYNKPITILFDRVGYNLKLFLKYPNKSFINSLQLGLDNNTLPIINSINYLNNDNAFVPILINNEKSIDLNTKVSKDGLYTLDFNTIFTDQIVIDISTNLFNKLDINSVKTFFNTYAKEGEIIFGPIATNSPILKATIESSTITPNSKLFISTDLSSWYSMDTTTSLNLDQNKSKIISFNTINSKSFKSEKDITSLYVMLKIQPDVVEYDSKNLITIKETSLTNNSSDVVADKYSVYRIKNYPISYNKLTIKNNVKHSDIPKEAIESITFDNRTLLRGFKASPVSYTDLSTDVSNISYKHKYKKVSYDNVEATTIDPVDSILIDILPVKESIIISNNITNNIIYKTKVPEGIYKLISPSGTLTIDLTTPFTSNSINTIIITNHEDVKIINEVEETIYTIPKETLHTVEYLGVVYYYIDLEECLYDKIDIQGYTKSVLYPITPLDTFEYALVDGKIVLGLDAEIQAEVYSLKKYKREYIKHISYTNGNYLERIDDEDVRYNNSTLVTNNNKVIKLNNIFIKKGSISFTRDSASDTENYTPDVTPDIPYIDINNDVYLNVNETDNNLYLEL